ncbi:MAG: toll/interleukin-1 receptor domain-containing protein, partial [Cyanobacteria bacterium J06627_8]
MPKKHIFLSYCRDNKQAVTALYADLIKAGEQVWWDQDILPGQDWKLEIRKAMKDAYAVLICFSKETQARTTTGIYPEALDAIGEFRNYAPGNIFLIPVRLSECDIPMFEIGPTRTLADLQYIDLFPAAQRDKAFQKLIRSLQLAPNRPATLPSGTAMAGTASTSTPSANLTS